MAKLGLMALLNLDITRFENNMKKASKQTTLIQDSMKSLGTYVAGAFSAVELVSFLKKGMEAYQMQIEAETKLKSALGDRQDIMQRLANQASSLEDITLFDDHAIIQAQSFFATLGLGEEAIKKLTPLVIDFAARFGMDLDAAAKAVGKAMTGSGKAFKDLGFEIEGAAGSGERFDSVLRQLNSSVKGQAAELAKLDVNAIKRLTVAWENFWEQFGETSSSPVSTFLDYFTARLKTMNIVIDFLQGKGKAISGVSAEITKFFEEWVNADEDERKKMEAGWAETLQNVKKDYNRVLLTTGTQGDAAEYLSGQKQMYEGIFELIKKYQSEQRTATRVDQDAMEAANKLAEARLKAAQARDLEFIQTVGYKPTPEKADFQKGKSNEAILGELEKSLEISREIPTIIERSTVNMAALTAVTGQQITIWQMLGESIKEVMENSMTFENVFMEMVNSNITGLEEMGKAMWNMARQMIAMELAQTIAAAVRSALQSVPFPFNVIAAGGAAAAAGTLFNTLVPQLAGGGIATAPTLAMVGEYPGARSNPEVIAPLSKLQGMLGNPFDKVHLESRVQGSDLLMIHDRSLKQRTRVRGF